MTPTTPAEFVAWLRKRALRERQNATSFAGFETTSVAGQVFEEIADKAEQWLVTDKEKENDSPTTEK